jgi:hypothetical protein
VVTTWRVSIGKSLVVSEGFLWGPRVSILVERSSPWSLPEAVFVGAALTTSILDRPSVRTLARQPGWREISRDEAGLCHSGLLVGARSRTRPRPGFVRSACANRLDAESALDRGSTPTANAG